MKISIIVPVYQTEKTLERCIHSVLEQTYSKWEMLLIDDGSYDGGPQMCDEYAQKDPRIMVIHQENKGLGAARNMGIHHAAGDYLLFLDSDDFIAPETLSTALEAFDRHPKVRFVEFGVHKWHGANDIATDLCFNTHVYDGKWDYWFNAQGYEHCYACNKLFRKDVFSNIRFKEGKKFEDVYTMISILNENEAQYLTISPVLYYYCYNQEGITANAGASLRDLLEALTEIFHDIKWHRPQGVTRKAYTAFCAHALNVQIDVYERCGKEEVMLRRLPFALSPKMMGQYLLSLPLFCQIFCFVRSLCKKIR